MLLQPPTHLRWALSVHVAAKVRLAATPTVMRFDAPNTALRHQMLLSRRTSQPTPSARNRISPRSATRQLRLSWPSSLALLHDARRPCPLVGKTRPNSPKRNFQRHQSGRHQPDRDHKSARAHWPPTRRTRAATSWTCGAATPRPLDPVAHHPAAAHIRQAQMVLHLNPPDRDFQMLSDLPLGHPRLRPPIATPGRSTPAARAPTSAPGGVHSPVEDVEVVFDARLSTNPSHLHTAAALPATQRVHTLQPTSPKPNN